jgi:hypothetical protein
MITERLLDVVSCEFKKKCLKKGGPVEAMTKTLNYRKIVKSSSISLLVFTLRKGIAQLLECDDYASFMSKYSTRTFSSVKNLSSMGFPTIFMFM